MDKYKCYVDRKGLWNTLWLTSSSRCFRVRQKTRDTGAGSSSSGGNEEDEGMGVGDEIGVDGNCNLVKRAGFTGRRPRGTAPPRKWLKESLLTRRPMCGNVKRTAPVTIPRTPPYGEKWKYRHIWLALITYSRASIGYARSTGQVRFREK